MFDWLSATDRERESEIMESTLVLVFSLELLVMSCLLKFTLKSFEQLCFCLSVLVRKQDHMGGRVQWLALKHKLYSIIFQNNKHLSPLVLFCILLFGVLFQKLKENACSKLLCMMSLCHL